MLPRSAPVKQQTELFLEPPGTSDDIEFTELIGWVRSSESLFLKKLSRNDIRWSFPGKQKVGKQNGVYIPEGIRRSAFFPPLTNVKSAKPHIFEVPSLKTLWPQTGDEPYDSHVVHYSNKGPEAHFTRIPKIAFSTLSPASLLLGGRLIQPVRGAKHWFATLDSVGEAAQTLESILDLPADFRCALYVPADFVPPPPDEEEQLIKELVAAIRANDLKTFLARNVMPTPSVLAARAQSEYLERGRVPSLDPYQLSAPGDALMMISRDIEYRIYKHHERRHRAAAVLRILLARKAGNGGNDLVSALVRSFGELDATFLSAGQQRKSRGGLSFELHIGRMLKDSGLPFATQVITGSRRPDFVMPSLKVLKKANRNPDEALVLAAKTTLRERWKQVQSEKLNCVVFLATVDDRVSKEAISQIASMGVVLVVPESLRKAPETWYSKSSEVITFRQFFDDEVKRKRLPLWTSHKPSRAKPSRGAR
jgi:hypothetical protein